MFLLYHPLLNMPALSHILLPTPSISGTDLSPHIHTPSACLSSAAARRKFIAAPDSYGQILIKCCFAAICLIGHKRDVLSMCSLCLRLPACPTHRCSLLPAPCFPGYDHGEWDSGEKGRRGERSREAAGLEKAGMSPTPFILTVLY